MNPEASSGGRILRALPVLLLVGCTSSLDIAGSAVIECSADSQCPDGYSCDTDRASCVEGPPVAERPTAPSVSLLGLDSELARPITTAGVRFTVSDPNVALGDRVSMRFEYGIGASGAHDLPTEWFALIAEAGAPSFDAIDARELTATFEWNLLENALTDVGGLSTDPENRYAQYTDRLYVRAVATDSTGRASDPALLGPLEVGNIAPTTELAGFGEPVYGGLIPISLTISDTTSDPAEVEVQFQLPDDSASDTWRPASLGGPTEATTTPEGRLTLVGWRSFDEPATTAPAATPDQGVGRQRADGVRVRARAVDFASSPVPAPGPWSAVQTIPSVRNQTPPQIVNPFVLQSRTVEGSNPFYVAFELVDEQGDTADLRAELSFDQGDTWTPVNEALLPKSEGFFDLTTAIPDPQGGGGIAHVIALDPAGLTPRLESATLRLSATDGFPAEGPEFSSVELRLTNRLGSPPNVREIFDSTGQEPFLAAPVASSFVDYDGDGDLDVAVVHAAGLIEFLLNEGGTLVDDPTAALPIPVGAFPLTLDHADLNSDGRDDHLTANSGSSSVTIALSNVGSFTTTSYAVGSSPSQAVFHDIDGDLVLDILVACDGSGTIEVLLGEGGGTFSSAVPFSTGDDAKALAVADFTGDGRADVVTTNTNASTDETLALLPGQATGPLLGAAIPVATGASSTGAALRAVDLNRDGLPDLVAAMVNPDQVQIYENESGSLRLVNRVPAEDLEASPNALACGTLDSDVEIDCIAVGNYHDAYVLQGNLLRPGVNVELILDADGDVTAVDIGDTNGDGYGDIVVTQEARDTVAHFESVGGRGVGGMAAAPWESFVSGLSPTGLVSADFNFDGVPDLALSDSEAQRVTVYLSETVAGLPAGSFASPETLLLPAGPSGLVSADLDRDGDPDLAALVQSNPSVVHTFLNELSGGAHAGFVAGNTVEVGPSFRLRADLVAADFNHDGITDLIAERENTTLSIIIGNSGTGGWSGTATDQPIPSSIRDIAIGDFDGDGRDDFAVTYGSAPSEALLRFFLGDGAGGFGIIDTIEAYPTSLAPQGQRFAVADFNGDGFDDAAVGSGAGLSVALGGSAGLSRPTSATTYPSNDGAGGQMAVGDLDGDGVLDLVGSTLEQLLPWRGVARDELPSGAFRPDRFPERTEPLSFISEPRILDLNGDGGLDVAFNQSGAGLTSIAYGRDLRATARGSSISELELVGITEPRDSRWSTGSPARIFWKQPAPLTPALKRLAAVELRATGGRFVPVSTAHRITGLTRLTRVSANALPEVARAAGDRLRVTSRLGARTSALTREELDLDDGRFVVAAIPLTPSAETALASGTLRVFALLENWERSDAVGGDPLDDPAYLPRVADPNTGDWADRFRRTITEVELIEDADGDLTTGSGHRFRLDDSVSPPVVYVATDREGVFVATSFEP